MTGNHPYRFNLLADPERQCWWCGLVVPQSTLRTGVCENCRIEQQEKEEIEDEQH